MTPQSTTEIDPSQIKRIIGTIEGGQNERRVVYFAGIHGNEPAGIIALTNVINYIKENDVPFYGKLWALEGNLPALHKNKRFIDKDLNRIWFTKYNDSEILPNDLVEVKERSELRKHIKEIICSAKEDIYFFDLHTTSSHSIPFVSISDTLRNRKILEGIPVPVVLGLEEKMDGTLFNFFSELGISMSLFEAGKHDLASSIDNHEAFIWMTLVKLNFIQMDDLPDLHEWSNILAKEGIFHHHVFELNYRHKLNGKDNFKMIPGFVNFQKIRKGQILAYDIDGPVKSPYNGRIFMPLYQDQGLEGFFIIREISLLWLKVSEFVRKLGIDNYLNLLPGVSKHKEFPNCYIINKTMAKYIWANVFHLLGFRKVIRHDHKYIVKRRPFDWKPPSIEVIKQRFRDISV
jgi:succinylglutamate desuccinylase